LLIMINKRNEANKPYPQKRRVVMRNKVINSQDARLNVQISFFPCRHLISGRTTIPKICIYNNECWKCAFDQWLDELETRQDMLATAA
jgi:hypothetical protein